MDNVGGEKDLSAFDGGDPPPGKAHRLPLDRARVWMCVCGCGASLYKSWPKAKTLMGRGSSDI